MNTQIGIVCRWVLKVLCHIWVLSVQCSGRCSGELLVCCGSKAELILNLLSPAAPASTLKDEGTTYRHAV